jgi:hypothetical protein
MGKERNKRKVKEIESALPHKIKNQKNINGLKNIIQNKPNID